MFTCPDGLKEKGLQREKYCDEYFLSIKLTYKKLSFRIVDMSPLIEILKNIAAISRRQTSRRRRSIVSEVGMKEKYEV